MIGIVILNFNNWNDTEKCIESIYKTIGNLSHQVYIVDNASRIKIPHSLSQKINENKYISIIYNEVNTGYSAGNNVGVKYAIDDNCDAILIANNDIIFLEESISRMHNKIIENPEIGIIGPKIYNLDGTVHTPAMLIKTGMKEKYLVNTFLRKVYKKSANNYYCNNEEVDKKFEPHAVSGCCFLMSKECALNITPFDENTFLFEEELIIGLRMEESNLKTLYFPESSVIHAHGQSTKNLKSFSYICKVESEIYYCRKYLNTKLHMILPFYAIRTLGYFVKSFNNKDFRKNTINYFSKTFTGLLKSY